MKRILLVAGEINSLFSYEYQNFLKPLEKMGYLVTPFDFMVNMREMGKDGMNHQLLEVVKKDLPLLVLFVPQTDQLMPNIIDEISQHTKTLGYLYDDMWRIEYSRFWSKHYNFITTSDINGVRKFKEKGINNVIYSPFACNTDIYSKMNIPKLYDISFIGGYHPYRAWYIKQLTKAGLKVNVWGRGWPEGAVNYEQMVKIFNQSRINLNLSNCVSWDFRYMIELGRPLKSTIHIWREAWRAIKNSDRKTVEQVKARHFEINACGGFQLSYYVEGLESLFKIGEEITLFLSPEDLVEKAKYYLKNGDERELIAQKGYKRTILDHKMEDRFSILFDKIFSSEYKME